MMTTPPRLRCSWCDSDQMYRALTFNDEVWLRCGVCLHYVSYIAQSDAAHYEANSDDEAEWGEPEQAPTPPKRRLASMISTRLSPDESDLIRQAAERASETLSNFVRQAAINRCRTVLVEPTNEERAALLGSVVDEIEAENHDDAEKPYPLAHHRTEVLHPDATRPDGTSFASGGWTE